MNCLDEVKLWLANNFLTLNDSKTEVIVFGPSDKFEFDISILGNLSFFNTSCVRNLGVFLDSRLTLEKQVSSVVASGFYQLRLLAKIKHFIPEKSLETAIHAFITSRLDYCNSLYCGISKAQLTRLQLVQNAAAKFLTKTRKFDHVTPILRALHWLPVQYRIDYKILLLVFKCLHHLAPSYLSELIHVYSPSRVLRSSNLNILAVPCTRLKRRGDRAFSVVGPRLWNNLPIQIRTAHSLPVFKSLLKTHLFSLAFNTI